MIIDVSEHRALIEQAARQQLDAITGSHAVDRRDDWALQGKVGEAIAAVYLGIPVESILDDGPGVPDFIIDDIPIDVKTAPPQVDTVNIRQATLRHPSWLLMVVRVHGWIGWVIGTIRVIDVIRHRPEVRAPVPGQKSPYVPLDLALLAKEAS